jgi:hypothetical protein
MNLSSVAEITDSLATHPTGTANLRGVEREERYSDETLRSAIDVLFFIPRESVDGLLYLTGRGLQFATDPDVIEKVENILYFHKYRAGWHPLLNIDGDWNLEMGAKLFYRGDRFESSIRGKYVEPKHWKTRAELELRNRNAAVPWNIELSGIISEREDREYYGIGNYPATDSRSHFLPETDEESGEYFQRLKRLQFIAGIETGANWTWRWTSYIQERFITNPEDDDDVIKQVFEISQLAGVGTEAMLAYSEISLGFDSRDTGAKTPVGIDAEGYVGYTGGIDKDIRFLRSGIDFAWHIPVIKQNRLIVPRLAFNMIENLNDEAAVPFAEYPQHPTFRGVSSRHLLRIDNLSLVPSFEYRWPLTHVLQSCLFVDGLMVAQEIDKLTIADAPWAAGLGMNLRLHYGEQAGFRLAFGSEGFRGTLYLGLPGDKTARSEWN